MSTQTDQPGSSGQPGSTSEQAHRAADQAGQLASGAGEHVKEVAAEAVEQTKAVASEARRHVDDLFGQARTEVSDQLGQRTTQAAGGMRTLAEQISALLDGRSAEAGPLPGYLREARAKTSQFAERLERRGPEGVAEDLTSFARRRPGLFLLGASALGFVVGRAVRAGAAASSPQSSGSQPASSTPSRAPFEPAVAQQPTPFQPAATGPLGSMQTPIDDDLLP